MPRAISLTGVPVCEPEKKRPRAKKAPAPKRSWSSFYGAWTNTPAPKTTASVPYERIDVTSVGDSAQRYIMSPPGHLPQVDCPVFVPRQGGPDWKCACGYNKMRHTPQARGEA